MIRGTAVIVSPTKEGLLVIADKLGVDEQGNEHPNQVKLTIREPHLVIALLGVCAEPARNGDPDLVLLDLVKEYFTQHAFTGSKEQFEDLEVNWRDWFKDYCERNRRCPKPVDLPAWAKIVIASNAQSPPLAYLLDFLYTREGDNASFSVVPHNLSYLWASGKPEVYGTDQHKIVEEQLKTKLHLGTLSEDDRAMLAYLSGSWKRENFPLQLGVKLAVLVMRDIHLHARDSQGRAFVGSTVDIALLPWTGNVRIIASNTSVLEEQVSIS